MAYLHYRLKNWEPCAYYRLKEGEKKIARAFMNKEIEDRNKETDEIREKS